MKEKDISDFEKIHAQLLSFHVEISGLAKKSSNDALNNFKLKFVNQTILDANSILGKKYRPFTDFEKFDDNDLPTNSDVAMMLGQYLNCMEKLRADNVKEHFNDWYWIVDGKQSSIKTGQPLKIKK